MESLNGHYAGIPVEPIEPNRSDEPSQSRWQQAVVAFRLIMQRELGFGGYVIIGAVLIVLLIVFAYFFGDVIQLHGGAGPD